MVSACAIKYLRTCSSVFFVFLLLIQAACSNKPAREEYITIGALLPLTGESSDEGLRAVNGMKLAKEKINENGGISGKKLDIIVLNDRGDEDYIIQQYNALMEKGVVAIIGSSYSGPTIALAIASEKDGIPVISPTASNPNVTKGRSNVFRAIFIDDYQAEAMAYFAIHTLKAKNALVLSNRNIESFMQTANFFTDSFAAYGGQILAVEPYSSDDEFDFLMKKHKNSPPDVIYCPDDYIPAARLANAVYDTGFHNTFVLGSDAWDGLLAYITNPGAMENAYYSAPFSFDDHDPDVMNFVRDYLNFFAQIPLSGSATAYSCVYILAEAIKKAGSRDSKAIVQAIKTNELDLITGHIKFDENNNPRPNVYIMQIKGGVYSSIAKLSL